MIISYSAIFSPISFFFGKSSSVKLFSACSVLLSIFIRLSDGFNMLLKLFGTFLNLNENNELYILKINKIYQEKADLNLSDEYLMVFYCFYQFDIHIVFYQVKFLLHKNIFCLFLFFLQYILDF